MTLHLASLFEAVADVVPDRLAVVCGDRRATYAELDGRALRPDIPDTALPAAARARLLTPTTQAHGTDVERLLVLGLHDRTLFTPDADVRKFARQARAAGWKVVATVPLPGGGRFEVLRHRDRLTAGSRCCGTATA